MTSKSSNNKLISAIKDLRPYQVIDEGTGEIIDVAEWHDTLHKLIDYCHRRQPTC